MPIRASFDFEVKVRLRMHDMTGAELDQLELIINSERENRRRGLAAQRQILLPDHAVGVTLLRSQASLSPTPALRNHVEIRDRDSTRHTTVEPFGASTDSKGMGDDNP